MSYQAFVHVFEEIENRADLRYCGCEIPRTKNNWPAIEPEVMDDLQVVFEALSWRSTARNTHPGTVGGSQWLKYTDELIRRGLMDGDCQKRFDIDKILTRDWNDLPPGPIIVHPVIAKPVEFEPKPESLFKRALKVLKSTIRIN